jgi:plasmid maintenance system antidote protein VapI
MEPPGISQTVLAEKTALPCKRVNELCRDRHSLTADTALCRDRHSLTTDTALCRDRHSLTADTALILILILILIRVLGTLPEFWLNTQGHTDIWEALNTPKRLLRIQRAKPARKVSPRRVSLSAWANP